MSRGTAKMSIPERREAVKELAGDGHSTREIADVVGVAHKTVARDLAVSNDTAPDKADTLTIDSDSDSVSNDTAPRDDPPPEKSQAAKDREEAEIRRLNNRALSQNLADLSAFSRASANANKASRRWEAKARSPQIRRARAAVKGAAPAWSMGR
jgi:hypothetical protein